MKGRREPGWLELLADVLRDTPRLDEAACRGRHVLFDPAEQGADFEEEQYRAQAAIALCKNCPALDACRQFAATQRNLCGIVAGEVHYYGNGESTGAARWPA